MRYVFCLTLEWLRRPIHDNLSDVDHGILRLRLIPSGYCIAAWRYPSEPPVKIRSIQPSSNTWHVGLTHLAKSLAQPGIISAARPISLPKCEYKGNLSVPFSLLSSLSMIASATSSGSSDGAIKGKRPPHVGNWISENSRV